MVPSQFLACVDTLTQLDPVGTYPQRGAAAVARIARAERFELVLTGLAGAPRGVGAADSIAADAMAADAQASQAVAEGDPQAHTASDGVVGAPDDAISGDGVVSMPLRSGRRVLGVLRLHPSSPDQRFPAEDLRVARWGARTLARYLGYAERFATVPARGASDGVHAALARTSLSRREREVVALLVAGRATREIAARTGLTIATIHTYLKRIYPKLGVHSRVELVARLAGTAQPSARRATPPRRGPGAAGTEGAPGC